MRKEPTPILRKSKPAPEAIADPVESAPEPFEPAPVPVDAAVTLQTDAAAPGYYRVVIAIVDEHGHAKQVDFTISAEQHASLIERSSWDQFFYPALLRLTQL